MNNLEQFLGVIKVADQPLSNGCTAYYMDGGKGAQEKPDLRKHVGLGGCHCCDYFLSGKQSITLIEETRLSKTVDRLRAEYGYLDETKRDEAVKNRIRDEMQLKAYGAMLVLCRLSMKCASAKNLIQGKKYQFWLVASSITTQDEERHFDYQKDSLKRDLTQVLGKTLLDEVDVLSADTLKERLSGAAL